ncbi:MAG: hypothetical protein IH956_03845 [Chloroflexi bacterium]|nr:hypothetical protein [Chloroflexota bacterium]
MADGTTSARLARLSAEADRALRSFLRRTALFAASSATAATSTGTGPQTAEGAPVQSTGEGNARGVVSRDERGQRALAKEIKRLITEDKRRGLPV